MFKVIPSASFSYSQDNADPTNGNYYIFLEAKNGDLRRWWVWLVRIKLRTKVMAKNRELRLGLGLGFVRLYCPAYNPSGCTQDRPAYNISQKIRLTFCGHSEEVVRSSGKALTRQRRSKLQKLYGWPESIMHSKDCTYLCFKHLRKPRPTRFNLSMCPAVETVHDVCELICVVIASHAWVQRTGRPTYAHIVKYIKVSSGST